MTVTGRISKVGRTNGGEHAIEIRECKLFYIITKRLDGCRVGRKITADGSFVFCDELSFEMDLCIDDYLDESRVTCR